VNRRAPIIAGAIVLLVALLAVFLLVLPKMSEVGETEDQLQETQDQEINLAAQLNALEDAEAAAPDTELEIAAIDEQVPPTADLPSLFRLLQGAADRAAVDFFSFTPGTPVPNPTGSYSTIASQITVSGGYFAIDEFLFLLETLQRAAKVTTLAVTPSAGGEGTTTTSTGNLQLQITVEFYTTDSSAGPGSIPGPTEGVTTTGV
jgi:Tfp pilus assembly protein PilO